MTEVKQQPGSQENTETPERVAKAPEGEYIEVRDYDALYTAKVIGDIAIDTRGAITKVNTGEGPKPIPSTVKVAVLSSDDIRNPYAKPERRLQEIYKLLDPKLTTDIDKFLIQKIEENPNDMDSAMKTFAETATFGFRFDELNVGDVRDTEVSDKNNTRGQIEAYKQRKEFIGKLVEHGSEVIQFFLNKRLSNYGGLDRIGRASPENGRPRSLRSKIENGEVKYFFDTFNY